MTDQSYNQNTTCIMSHALEKICVPRRWHSTEKISIFSESICLILENHSKYTGYNCIPFILFPASWTSDEKEKSYQLCYRDSN